MIAGSFHFTTVYKQDARRGAQGYREKRAGTNSSKTPWSAQCGKEAGPEKKMSGNPFGAINRLKSRSLAEVCSRRGKEFFGTGGGLI